MPFEKEKDKGSYIREYYKCLNKYLYLKKLYNQLGGDNLKPGNFTINPTYSISSIPSQQIPTQQIPQVDPEVRWCQTIKMQMNPEDIELIKVIYRTIVPIRDRHMYMAPMPPYNITPANFLVYKQVIYNFINGACREASVRSVGDDDGDPTTGVHIDPMVQWCQNSYSQINADTIDSIVAIYDSIPKDKQNMGGIYKPSSHINNKTIFIYKQIIYNYIDNRCGIVHDPPAPPPNVAPPSITPSGPPKVSLSDRIAEKLSSSNSKPKSLPSTEITVPLTVPAPST